MNSLDVQTIVSQADFQATVLEAAEPTLVYFWGPWCSSCRSIAPRIEAVAQDNQALFKVVKADVSKVPELAEKYGVMTIPTMLLFKPGNPQPVELLLSTYVKDWTGYINRRCTA
jgi:thioredoxin 1